MAGQAIEQEYVGDHAQRAVGEVVGVPCLLGADGGVVGVKARRGVAYTGEDLGGEEEEEDTWWEELVGKERHFVVFLFSFFFFFGVEKGGERGEGGGSLQDHKIDIALLKLINFFEETNTSNIVITLW